MQAQLLTFSVSQLLYLAFLGHARSYFHKLHMVMEYAN